jgi:inosine-uridine nucleoside N-ribohydrolase
MPARPRIILDCDPGHDDAVAILMAARHSELLGITTVSGNVPLALTTHNALVTAQILGLSVPVHAGAGRPLVNEPRHAEFIHGKSGLGGPTLPELEREAASFEAVRFIVDTARSQEDIYLVATGPLTNVALALRSAPDIAARLKGISLMGGSATFGNVTPAAEFNVIFDPEAADIVFRSGLPLMMCGLNLTHQVMVGPEHIAEIRALAHAPAIFVADMLEFYSQAYAKRHAGRQEAPLHDPCAVLALSHPELFSFTPRHVVIELFGRHTRGMTLVDERGVTDAEPPNAQVGYAADAEGILGLLLEALRAYG